MQVAEPIHAQMLGDEPYRLLIDAVSDLAIYLLDPAGLVSSWNSGARRFKGYAASEILGQHFSRFYTPEDCARDEPSRGLRAAAREGRFENEGWRVRKDGSRFWANVIITAIRGPDGGLQGFAKVTRDASAQREAQRSISESEARYRLLAEHGSDMVFQLDHNLMRRYVSAACRDVLGFESSELIGTRPIGMIHPDDAPRVTRIFRSVLDGEIERADVVNRIRHAHGHYVWVEARVRPFVDPATGTVIGIIGALRDISARKAAEEKLEHANRLLVMAEEVAHVGHWRVELPHQDLNWSGEVYRIFGLDPQIFRPDVEDAIGMFHPEDRAEVRFSFESAIALRRPYEFQARILRPGDEIRHVLCRGLCEVDAATDHLRAVFGTVMDVTDVTLSERRLAEKSSNLEATLENIDQGLLKVASDGTIELSNRRYSDLLDVPAGLIEGAGRQWRDVLDHLDRRGEFANLDATGLRRHQEARLAPGTFERVRPDGRIVEVRIARLPDGSSVLTYADITGRRQAEIAMQQSETRYRVLADSTSDVITQLDLEFKRQYVSPACRTVFGYAPEEMLGLRPSATIHPDDAVEVRALARRLAAGKLPDDRAVTTYRALHKRGHYVWIEASMSLVRDGITGAPTSLICSLRDVTERQRAARHLQRAKAAAEQAARVKADFLANMSHELRTPLTGMLGVHDLLRNQPGLNDAQRRLLGLASDSGRALLTIVNDILDFSKIEAGQLEIESVPFSLHGVVDSCLALAAEGLQGKPISIETTYRPPHIDGFVGDPTRLRQILLNLLTNAVKFTERGRIGIDVLHQADKRLRIEVTDTGIGVPAEKISALFERFGQADSSVNRRYGGTGLGLAICKGLLGLMGGTIGFEARPQGGSTFWFELPLAQHDDPEAPAVCAEALRPAGARRRILLAEDNAINGEIIATMLSGRGHDVAVVADGQAAVQAAQSGIDVILMDLQMPVMDGLTATTLIRANERASQRPRTPIVGLTANAMAEDVERCVRAGMDAHVAKPIDWPTLFATLDRLLAGPGREPAAAQNDEEDPAVVVLDETILATLSDLIGRGRIASILARFVADLEARIADLKGAAATVAQVHSLASIAGQLGFLQLHQLCMMIEQEARDGVSRDHSAMLREVAGRAARAAAASDFAHAPS